MPTHELPKLPKPGYCLSENLGYDHIVYHPVAFTREQMQQYALAALAALAAQPSPAAVECKPLTLYQIEAVYEKAMRGPPGSGKFAGDAFIKFVRAIEAAHGINATPAPSATTEQVDQK